jgi:hypothetical protein
MAMLRQRDEERVKIRDCENGHALKRVWDQANRIVFYILP